MNRGRRANHRLGLLIVLTLLSALLFSCTAAPIVPESQGEVVTSASAPAPPQFVEFNADLDIASAISASYGGATPQDLAVEAWAIAQQIYGEPEIVAAACNDPVYLHREYDDPQSSVFAGIANYFNKPILWTALVNFAKTKETGYGEAFVGCFMPYHKAIRPERLPGMENPGEPGVPVVERAYIPARNGHPFLCYPVTADGSALPPDAIPSHRRGGPNEQFAVDGALNPYEVYHAEFDGNTYLWCPTDFAWTLLYWESNHPDSADTEQSMTNDNPYGLGEEALNHLKQYWVDADNSVAFTETKTLAEREVNNILNDNSRLYDYVMAVAGIQNAEAQDDSRRVPLLDYLPACHSGHCGMGYRTGLTQTDDTGTPPLFAMYQALSGATSTTGPFEPLDVQAPPYCTSGTMKTYNWGAFTTTQYETCGFTFPGNTETSSLFAMADIGTTESAPELGGALVEVSGRDELCEPMATYARSRAIDYNDTANLNPMHCSGINVGPPIDDWSTPLWLGTSHFIIGMTRPGELSDEAAVSQFSVFKGVLEYVWFDPDQGRGD